MSGKVLTIIGSSPTVQGSRPVDAVIELWPEAERPHITSVTISQALAEHDRLEHCDVAWVLADDDDPNLLEVIALLRERTMPVLLTRTRDLSAPGTPFQDGVVLGPATAPPIALCGMLRALWSQGSAIGELHEELRLRSAHERGVCDQINKIDEELRLAAQLQRDFLPGDLPTVGNISFEVLFRPAGYVSGDMYDIFRLDDDHVGFFLADAMGHGVPAALITVFIKRSLQIREIDPGCPHGYRVIPPDETLAWLNHDLIQCGDSVCIATACYGVINCRNLVLTFARAGHPYPMLLRPDGSNQTITPDGGLLGVFPEETYELATVQLHPQDRLLIYSDGLEVAFSDAEKTTDPWNIANQPHTQVFRDLAQGTLQDAIGRLTQKIDQESGSLHQADDQTLLLVGIGDEAESVTPQYVADQLTTSPV